MLKDLRQHGPGPYHIAAVHGGPGARGEMYPVALELSLNNGVLEPLQAADSVEGQVEELKTVLENFSLSPRVLIGFSWGAWLSFILAAQYPRLVDRLILVSSGPFEQRYCSQMLATRLGHLDVAEKSEARALLEALNSNCLDDRGFARFGALMEKADAFDPLPPEPPVETDGPGVNVYQKIWDRASQMRQSGELLQFGERIRCPVTAIHGDYDPHPAEGVDQPLRRVLSDFRFILLTNCGHHPWLERRARADFYRVLRQEIAAGLASRPAPETPSGL